MLSWYFEIDTGADGRKCVEHAFRPSARLMICVVGVCLVCHFSLLSSMKEVLIKLLLAPESIKINAG
jgi:hypothetical protein